MSLTGIHDCNQIIYSYLDLTDLARLRATSSKIKKEVEQSKTYKEYAANSFGKNTVTQKKTIYNFQKKTQHHAILSLDSNKNALRIAAFPSYVGKIDPNGSVCTESQARIKTANLWKKVVWSKQNNLAIASDAPSKNKRDTSPHLTTDIFDTGTGKRIGQQTSHLLPTFWQDDRLFMESRKNQSIENLFIWNPKEETSQPEKIFSFQNEMVTKVLSQNEAIYCFEQNSAHPFSIIDLNNVSLTFLAYQLKNPAGPIRNFGLTRGKKVYFSEKKSFVMLNSAGTNEITKIQLPFIPTGITFEFPFMACYQNYQFQIYDIRKNQDPLYSHSYLTGNQTLLLNFSNSPQFDIQIINFSIDSITLHNGSLFVVMEDHSIDFFNLAANPESLQNQFNFRGVFNILQNWNWNLFSNCH